MDGSKHISTDFSLYGLGDGENLFSDLETLLPSENKSAFGGAADPSKLGKGQYWKPEADNKAAMENFRAIVFDNDL